MKRKMNENVKQTVERDPHKKNRIDGRVVHKKTRENIRLLQQNERETTTKSGIGDRLARLQERTRV